MVDHVEGTHGKLAPVCLGRPFLLSGVQMQLVAVVARRADYPEIGKVRLQRGDLRGQPTQEPHVVARSPRQSKGELRFDDHA